MSEACPAAAIPSRSRAGCNPATPRAPAPSLRAGRFVSLQLAKIGKEWQRRASERMPTATGDIREIVGQVSGEPAL